MFKTLRKPLGNFIRKFLNYDHVTRKEEIRCYCLFLLKDIERDRSFALVDRHRIKALSPKFASNIQRIQANSLISIAPEIIKKPLVF